MDVARRSPRLLRAAAAAVAAWNAAAPAAPGVAGTSGLAEAARQEAPEGDATRLLEAELRTQAFRLWEAGAFGLDRSERAAWVVASPAGIAWRTWPWDRRYLQSRWLGPIPAGAIAIVHTHPGVVDPRPSFTDRATAARLGVAVYTVSRSGIWKAEPGGAVTRAGDERWWAGCEARKPCREGLAGPSALASTGKRTRGETGAETLRISD